jgi:hypothetical protein
MSRTRIDVSLINIVSSILNMGSNKITGLANGTAATDAMAFGQNHVFQVVSFTTTATTSTTSSTFTNTGTAATITPTSSSSKILILVSGVLENDNNNINEYVTIKRGSIDLSGGSGFGYSRITATGLTVHLQGQSIVYLDSPSTTSATTYTIAIRNNDNTSTVFWNDGSGTCTMSIVLIEVQ